MKCCLLHTGDGAAWQLCAAAGATEPKVGSGRPSPFQAPSLWTALHRRLLAMEVYDTCNADGLYCNLITGA